MSVPVREQGSAPRVQSRARVFLGCVLALLAGSYVGEIAGNKTSFAQAQPGQLQNISIHYKTARVADVVPLDAVWPNAALAERNITVQPRTVKSRAVSPAPVQLVSATVADDVRPQKLDVVPSFAKADEEAGRAPPPPADLQQGAGVAIYDIERGRVYLPNGETLEAHSGMGPMRDNPAFVNRRNRGPTPPHIYDLTLRERPFHGVEAIRLTPVGGEAAVFGRNGFLAHTYMLRRPGDSNGCVVFKEYHRFLAAFKKGQIKRMVVVPRLKEAPPSILAVSLPAKNS